MPQKNLQSYNAVWYSLFWDFDYISPIVGYLADETRKLIAHFGFLLKN